MRVRLIILTFFYLFFGVSLAFANDPPILTSPANNSTTTSTTLNWQAPSYSLYSTNPYRVQIHYDPSFSPVSSIYRDSYKTATTYTPELYQGTWYWRVEVRDSTGTWSSWSNTWLFTLVEATATPTPQPTSSPTSTPTPSATSTPTATASPSSSSFVISNTPSQINSDESFTVSVNLTSTNKDTVYYLSGAFKKVDGTRYFGLTKISSNWVSYSSIDYLNQYKITTDNTGSWTGSLEVKPDTSDSDYKGSGDYIFKVGKYTSSGSGPTWNNEEVQIKINDVNNLSSDDPPSSQAIPKTIPSDNPLPITTSKSVTSKISEKLSSFPKSASVAGISKISTQSALNASSTPSANIKVSTEKQKNNPFVLIGFIFIITGVGLLGHLIFREYYGSIYHTFRK